MKGKLGENDPNLKQQEKIIDHHPHHGFPQHGNLLKKGREWMKEYVKLPNKKHAGK